MSKINYLIILIQFNCFSQLEIESNTYKHHVYFGQLNDLFSAGYTYHLWNGIGDRDFWMFHVGLGTKITPMQGNASLLTAEFFIERNHRIKLHQPLYLVWSFGYNALYSLKPNSTEPFLSDPFKNSLNTHFGISVYKNRFKMTMCFGVLTHEYNYKFDTNPNFYFQILPSISNHICIALGKRT